MKRLGAAILLLVLLRFPVRAAEVSGPVALTFEGFFPEAVAALEDAGVRGTFFLSGAAQAQAGRLAAGKHEIGVDLSGEGEMALLSRRQIHGRLCAAMEGLPEHIRPRWLRPPAVWGDGLVQVAKVTGLSLAGCSVDARNGLNSGIIDQVRSGDVIALGEISREELGEFLRILRSRHLKPVTLSELARFRVGKVFFGEFYEKFPAGIGGEEIRIWEW